MIGILYVTVSNIFDMNVPKSEKTPPIGTISSISNPLSSHIYLNPYFVKR